MNQNKLLFFASVLMLFSTLTATNASAQISNGITTITPPTQVQPSRVATLTEYLTSRLRAASEDQREYVREVVKLVDQRKLEKRIVLALERYAKRKSPYFPLPVFERALRVEGAKRGVAVPTIKEIVARNGDTTARAIRESQFLR